MVEIVRGYCDSTARNPLVVVGAAPFADAYTQQIAALAASDDRVHLLGRVDDQSVLDQLYANALTYLHGHSVGGTNPSLLRAMGAGTGVIAYDVSFNRDVLGRLGRYCGNSGEVGRLIEAAEANAHDAIQVGVQLRQHARDTYDWDVVARQYEGLCVAHAGGYSTYNAASGKRRKSHT